MNNQTPPELGVVFNDDGSVSFSVDTTIDACAVWLCVFGDQEVQYELTHNLGSTWWDEVPLKNGDRYGVRVQGQGHDKSKLLVDSRARAIDGTINWKLAEEIDAFAFGNDSAAVIPKAIALNSKYEFINKRPNVAWAETIIYEAHLKGLTKLHPDVDPAIRGTYKGLASPPVLSHLKSLGVTAIELLPVHHHVPEERLDKLGLTNYWGYNTLGYFAPHQAYAYDHSDPLTEFKAMVDALHGEGIEVLLDVVYNHTCEGVEDGLSISLRGLHGNNVYRVHDTTGTGNSLNASHPQIVRLILESLRFWVNECNVDGFRFDLLVTSMRNGDNDFDLHSALMCAILADPILRNVKLIAEPWDVGSGGYQVGGFPAPFAEWNDRFRNLVRDFWRGLDIPLGALANRLGGNSDLFAASKRQPWSSINFLTAHDGFTLADLNAYEKKLNHSNAEDNRDGTDDNRSNNHGIEGPTDEAEILRARKRTAKNMLATMFLSRGTPMLVNGDEFGRTQNGNNNAYCHDDETTWVDWENADQDLLDFVREVSLVRRSYGAFDSTFWLTPTNSAWLSNDGSQMTVDRWRQKDSTGLILVLKGTPDAQRNPRHATNRCDLLILIHEGDRPSNFDLPLIDLPSSSDGTLCTYGWELVFSTGDLAIGGPPVSATIEVEPNCVRLYAARAIG